MEICRAIWETNYNGCAGFLVHYRINGNYQLDPIHSICLLPLEWYSQGQYSGDTTIQSDFIMKSSDVAKR